ncbi:hypothetical protein NP233_g8129 [Leucocoprinus birnbaumii]|uniref:Uncharacterized protein n=1 Tax=Leucocoprinus birnbaumii TaxID=56174 RepID=A0AAD5VPH4_9AGAR|nr:hypothetical protein NP233_g8129 [Leucocoprinus birnbaumii]
MNSKTQSERKSSSQRPPSNPSSTAPATVAKAGPSNAPTHAYPFTYTNHTSQQKKMPRRSSKPIINWFQRKLAGTVRSKRSDTIPLAAAHMGRTASRANSSRVNARIVSSPVPGSSAQHPRGRDRLEVASSARRKTVSLNGDDDFQSSYNEVDSVDALDGLSMARDSLWSPASILEADDDASVRPLPPSAPPSPAPSRSSSSYLSDPRTFRSIAASTKPTTVLSIDLPGNGMAHIAQVPLTPSSQIPHRVQHMRQTSSGNPHSGGNPAVSFSALPSQSSRPSLQSNNQTRGSGPMLPVQAPLHTTHHPRNNPRPSSPPLDNASVLTLASSAYAMPTRLGPQGYGSTPPSAFSAGDSMSHFGGSMFPDAESSSLFVPSEDVNDERDASVRALRPRSSRRGSWGSEVSGWSAQMSQTPGTPSQERSLFTSNSVRSDEATTDNEKTEQESVETESPSDEGALTDTALQSSTTEGGESRYDDSIDTSRDLTGEQVDSVDLDTSTRACYRSTSLDTVGQSTIDKDMSTAMSNVKITEEKSTLG